jgi:hypothetical protein
MLRVTAVGVTAVAYPRENWATFEHRLSESSRIEVALPRQALSIPVFDDKRLAHSTIGAPDASFRLRDFDAPNVTATVTNRFVLFHAIILVRLYESGLNS